MVATGDAFFEPRTPIKLTSNTGLEEVQKKYVPAQTKHASMKFAQLKIIMFFSATSAPLR
jgi:hypothetical protein